MRLYNRGSKILVNSSGRMLGVGAVLVVLVCVTAVVIYSRQSDPSATGELSGTKTTSLTTSRESRSEQSVRVAVVGDQIAGGWNAANRQDAWPTTLEMLLNSAGIATSLSMYAAAGARVGAFGQYTPPEGASIVIIEAGTNDANGASPTPVQSFFASYLKLVGNIRGSQPEAHLICLGPWADPAKATEFNRAIRIACDGGTTITLDSFYSQQDLHSLRNTKAVGFADRADGFNPNSKGHREIAARIARFIETIS